MDPLEKSKSHEDDIDDAKDEWAHAMSNPDNVIISDSLSGLLSPEDLTPEIVNVPQTSLSCSFVFKDYEISGTLASYSDMEGIRTYAFITSTSTVSVLLNRSELKVGVILQSGNDNPTIIEVDEKTEVGLSVHIQDGSTSMVTISFRDATT